MKRGLVALCGLCLSLLPSLASAHVRFIATDDEVSRFSGYNFKAFFSPLQETSTIIIMVATVVVFLAVYFVFLKSFYLREWCGHIQERLESYKVYVPLFIRIIVAIAFIGAGTAGYFISPVLEASSTFALLQVFIGFLLFIGLFVEPMIILGIVSFVFALAQDMYLVGSLDLMALLVVMLMIDAEKPGVDDVLGIRDIFHLNFIKDYMGLILRFGIGFSMMFLALYEKVFNPFLSEFVVKVTHLTDVIPVDAMTWVFGAGIIEFLIGLVLIIGFKTRLTAVIAFLVLSLSFFYFGEEVTSHITLFGTLGAILILGPGKISVDNMLTKKC